MQINLWLTPDEAIDARADDERAVREASGLVVFEASPPAEWSHQEYNAMDHTRPRITALLEATGYRNRTVSYKFNRAVLFDSSYFHASGRGLRFKKGYRNRRINLTLLFGARCEGEAKPGS